MTTTARTREEIEDLKSQWLADGCWDIETTEGFEAHYDELKAFSEQAIQQWEKEATERVEKKAMSLGIPDKLELASYILNLEQRLERLITRIENLERK